MNKDFIENCKLLKSHFTKLTQAQQNPTTTQSKFDYESSSAAATINRAEQLLFLDRIDLLDKIDIEDIKQHALLKYATNNRLCEKNNKFKWDEDLYCNTSFPYNKEIIFREGAGTKADDYVTKKEEVLEKIQQLEEASKVPVIPVKIPADDVVIPKNIVQEKNKTTEKPKKLAQIENPSLKLIEVPTSIPTPIPTTIPTTIPTSISKQEVKKIKEMPELKIVPQKQIDVNTILEVKKIIPNNDDDDEDTTTKQELIDKSPSEENKKKLAKKRRNSHSSKINSFLENVEKFQKFKHEKSKSFVNLAESKTASKTGAKKNKSTQNIHNKLTSYAHRFKAQKSIIEMQKEKLMEQNKIIAELKLNKIQIQVKESLENAQKELKKISPIQKHKMKLLEEKKEDPGVEKNREINATLKLSKAPKMLQHMAERAKEREERRLLINERKRLLEEEKQKMIERALQKKMEDEQLEKQKRLAKLKEQREQLRQAELHKQELKQRYIEINETAYQHYKTKLKKRAIESFKMVIYRVRIKTEIGIRFYDNNIVIKYFKIWRENVTKLHDYKAFVANRFYKRRCLKQCMNIWRKGHTEYMQRNQVAIDRYEMSLQNNMFMAWLHYTRQCSQQFSINAKRADLHYNRAVLYRSIHCWRSLPAILAIERVQNERKRKWRLRVAQILTDYDPLKSETN